MAQFLHEIISAVEDHARGDKERYGNASGFNTSDFFTLTNGYYIIQNALSELLNAIGYPCFPS